MKQSVNSVAHTKSFFFLFKAGVPLVVCVHVVELHVHLHTREHVYTLLPLTELVERLHSLVLWKVPARN